MSCRKLDHGTQYKELKNYVDYCFMSTKTCIHTHTCTDTCGIHVELPFLDTTQYNHYVNKMRKVVGKFVSQTQTHTLKQVRIYIFVLNMSFFLYKRENM